MITETLNKGTNLQNELKKIQNNISECEIILNEDSEFQLMVNTVSKESRYGKGCFLFDGYIDIKKVIENYLIVAKQKLQYLQEEFNAL